MSLSMVVLRVFGTLLRHFGGYKYLMYHNSSIVVYIVGGNVIIGGLYGKVSAVVIVLGGGEVLIYGNFTTREQLMSHVKHYCLFLGLI